MDEINPFGQSACANCGVQVQMENCKSSCQFPSGELTIYQCFQLLFKCQDISSDYTSQQFYFLNLCNRCGYLLENIIMDYKRLLDLTDSNSYVSKLRREISQLMNASLPIPKFKETSTIRRHNITSGIQLHAMGDGNNVEIDPLADTPLHTPAAVQDETSANAEEHNFQGTSKKSQLMETSISSQKSVRITRQSQKASSKESPVLAKNLRKQVLRLKKEKDKSTSIDIGWIKSETMPVSVLLRNADVSAMESDWSNWTLDGEDDDIDSSPPVSKKGSSSRITSRYRKGSTKSHSEKQRKKLEDIKCDGDAALLARTDYKCDAAECQQDVVAFPTFIGWVRHQHSAHNYKTGYDLDDEDLKPAYGKVRPCPTCGMKSSYEHQILRHIKLTHLRQTSFPCELCPATFTQKSNLKIHCKTKHEENDFKFLCTLCGAEFANKSGLVVHENAHYDIVKKPHACDICNATFASKYRVRNHKNTAHSEERNHICQICGSKFKLQSHLNAHNRRVHVNRAKDKICEYCGKGFSLKHRLSEHLVGTHKLSVDDARISAQMKRGTIFRITANGDHIFKQKPGKPSKTCEYCGRTYARREYLFTHLISTHGKSEEESKQITGLESKRNLLPKSRANSQDLTST